MARTPQSTYSTKKKQQAVDSLKGDFTTKNFETVRKKFGCSLVSLRAWAEEYGKYVRRKQKNSKPSSSKPDTGKITVSVEEIEQKAAMLTEMKDIKIRIDKKEEQLSKIQQEIEDDLKLFQEKNQEMKKNFGIQL